MDIAAISSDDVWAVGGRDIIHWDGAQWSIVSFPPPPNAPAYGFNSISALSSNDIWAVGSSAPDGSTSHSLTMHWNGSEWNYVPSPDQFFPYSTLNSVSAVSPNDVWAVGVSTARLGLAAKMLSIHWDGTQWSTILSPFLGGIEEGLHAVDTAGPTSVWAVGYSEDDPVIIHWDGVSWSQATADLSGINALYSIEVVSPTDVWTVGSGGNPARTAIVHYDGTQWSRVSSPNVGSGSNYLYGVSATSHNNAWAVGTYNPADGWATLTLRYSYTPCITPTPTPCPPDWAVIPSPNNGDGSNWLTAISAIAQDDVWAFGSYTGTTTDARMLVEHWDGAGWSIVPNMESEIEWLHSYVAISANDIWAVGQGSCVSCISRTLTAHWDGTAWSIIPSPTGTRAGSLSSVWAASSTDVWAGGVALDSIFPYALLLHWDGTAWTFAFGYTPMVSIVDISGNTANDIWAVGSGLGSFTSHWDGSNWNTVTCPFVGTLVAVSSSAANDVWALGTDGIVHWDGTQWTISSTEFTNLSDIAALAADNVWVVGGNRIVHWDGTTWSEVSNPSKGTLNAIAPVGGSTLWAAGSINENGVYRTLIERWNRYSSFIDVHTTDYFYTSVQYFYCQGVVSGYSDGTFRPYNNTTRGQLTKIVVLAEGWSLNCPETPHFTDVPVDHPFYCFIETAFGHGIINGYADGTFRPGNDVTRGQLCKIVVSAQDWRIDTRNGPHFTDVTVDSPFYNYIETAYNHGIISGYADGTFQPGNSATRGQICKIVYQAVMQP